MIKKHSGPQSPAQGQTGFSRLLSEVYGEPVELPQHEETTPLNSRLPYAVVKNLGEVMLRAYHKEYGLPYTIFRFFNTYGPRQSEDFVITRFVQQALRHAPITLYGDGEQTRTFCHISDNIEATTAAMMQGHFINDVVNIGNPNQISIRALAEHIIAETQSRSPIITFLRWKTAQRRQPIPVRGTIATKSAQEFQEGQGHHCYSDEPTRKPLVGLSPFCRDYRQDA